MGGGKPLQWVLRRGRPGRRPTAGSGTASGGSTPPPGTIKPFTQASLERLETRTAEARKHFGVLPRRNARLQDGSVLPTKFSPFPTHMYGRPLEEFDQFIFEETFCAVSKRFNKNYVHRFTASKSFFIFSPWNPVRRACIFVSTNQYFDYFVMFTIISNCVFLAMTKPPEEAEWIFLAIYSLEALIKSIAKGFILNKYTYLRSPWNWLDFIVVVLGYVTLFVNLGNLAGLRTFRVLRALKTVSIMPGLRTIINALLNSLTQLVEVMSLTLFCLMVFALFALQVFMGVLRNKCVLEPDTAEQWPQYSTNSTFWAIDNHTEDFMLCGNGSGARLCPAGYVCLPGIGDNPNYGYTSFDTFLWSMLTTFQLITLDFWEDVYNKIIAAMGPWSILFFGLVVFFGSFYLINLMLAVVAMSYEEEAENTEEEKVKDLADHRDDSTFSFDPSNLKLHRLDKDSKFPTIRLKNHTIFASYKYNKKKKKKKAKGRKSVEGGVTKEDDSCVSADGHVSAVSPAARRVSELHDEHETNELRPRALVHELLSPDPRPVVVELPGAIRTPSVSPQRKQSSSSDRYAAAAQDPTEVSCDSSALNVRALPPSPTPAAAPPTTEAHPLRSSCEQLEATEKTSVQMFHGGELDEYYVHITTGQQPLGPAGSRGALDCTPTGDAADELAGLEDVGLDEDAVSPLAGHRSQGGGRREALRHAMFATSVESQGIGEMRGNSDSSTSEHRSAGDVRRLGMRECSLDDSGVVGDQETMSERGKNMMIRTEDITPLAKALDLEVTLTEKKCNGISPQRRSPSPSYVSHVVELHDETPDRNCDCCSSCCIWYETWLRWQNRLHLLVTDPCFDVFITLCIILNTAFLALEHYGMSNEMRQTLEIGNRVFTSIFTLECTLKVIAISKEFFRSGWNIFDLIVVVASLVELSLQNINGLSVLRVLRLLRVLKLAQSWTTMRVLLSIIISSLGALGNLTFVLVIVIYIFAVIGMQLFSNSYTADIFEPDPVPRWNFNDFFHSFMMIFRILCGEWIEPLWDCMRAKREESEMCLAVFLPALVMGNFLVLNLFLALLLNSFNCEELRTRKEGQVAPHGGPGIDLVTLRRRLRYLRRRLVRPAGRRASQPSPRPARRAELQTEPNTSSLSEGLDRECASVSTMRSHAGRTASPLLRESSADRMKGCTGCDQLPDEYTAPPANDGKKHISPGCSALGSSQEAKGKSKLVQSVQRLKGYIRSHRDPESRQREVIAAFESARVDQPARCALPPLPVSVSVPEIRRTLDETDLLSDSSDPLQAGYKQINA
ncbi:sodium channel protein 60E-like, partial [Amphibalanus amphitrite]|uniref:sodium channel protein 60E-like n=1 Tax=Amphibalanus amphitrite TaxID=1232801 RepID=UPI001C92259E